MRRFIALLIALAVALGAAALPATAARREGRGRPDSPGAGAGRAGGTPRSDNAPDTPANDGPNGPQDGGDGDGDGTTPTPDPDVVPGTPEETADTFPPCTDNEAGAVRFQIPVPGDTRLATGFYALPATNPVGMVVFSHGYGHSSYSWQHHLARVAQAHNVIAIAMDGRGLTFLSTEKAPGIPNTAGWPVWTAAEDGIEAAQLFEETCPTVDTIVNYGVSLGGNTSGIMAAARATRSNGTPLFDWWIDVEGVNNLIETYFEARGFDAKAAAVIEAENGGTFEQKPEAYRARTNVLRAGDMKAAGLKGVVLVHGVDDGLVPHNQSHEMFDALTAVGIPAQFFAVTLKSDESERETSGTGIIANRVDPTYRSPLAGHASEMSTTHIVSVTGFERLDAIFDDEPPACTRFVVVDGQVGSTPLINC